MENYLDFLFFFMLRCTPVENTFVSIPSLSFFFNKLFKPGHLSVSVLADFTGSGIY